MARNIPRVPWLLAALVAAPVAAQTGETGRSDRLERELERDPQRQQQLQQLRNISDYQPLRLEDAQPQSGLQGQLSFLNVDETGDDGLLVRPQLQAGLGERLELGAEFPAGRLEGETEVGPFEAHLLGQLLPEGDMAPALALKGTLITPSPDAGLSGELDALVTKTFGMQRLHFNAGYRTQAYTGNRYSVGLAADQALSEKVLLLGETYVERQADEGDTVVGADLGSVWQVGQRVQLMGSVGVRRFGGDVDPWVLFGVSGSS